MDKVLEKKLKGLISFIEDDLEPQLNWLKGEVLKLHEMELQSKNKTQ